MKNSQEEESNVEPLTLDWASIVASSLHQKFKLTREVETWSSKIFVALHIVQRKSIHGNMSAKHVCKTWGWNLEATPSESSYSHVSIHVYIQICAMYILCSSFEIVSAKLKYHLQQNVSTHVVMTSWSSWRRRLADHPRQLRFARESKHRNKHWSAIPCSPVHL